MQSSPKSKDYVKLGLATISALTLFTLYLSFLTHFANSTIFVPMNAVESLIFYTMILRALSFAFVPFLKKLHPQIKILVFSLEAFILCFLIVMYAFTQNISYNLMMAQVLTAWLGTALVVLSPYSIYELALMMYRKSSLTSIAISAGPLVAIILFLSNLAIRIPNPSNGLENFGIAIINSLRGQPSVGGSLNVEGGDLLVTGTSILFLLSLIIYIALTQYQSFQGLQTTPKYHYALVLMLVGGVLMLLWLLATSYVLLGNIIEIFSIPTVIIPVVLWVVSRD